MKNETIHKNAALVCKEIAVDQAPILYAERSEPEDEVDSGWQFICGSINEDWRLAQVWAIREVLDYDKSLEPFIEFPVGTILRRTSPDAEWKTSNIK